MGAASAIDYREIARRRLPNFLFEYIDGGAYDEVTLRANVADLQRIALRQRVLEDVSNIDTRIALFGHSYALPIALGPIGMAGMNARRGEVAAALAAQAAAIPFCLSTVSLCPLEEVSRGRDQPLWFQLYMMRDRHFMRDLLARAKAARCAALIFTVDMPMPGSRYRDHRSGLTGASGTLGAARRLLQAMQRPAWAWDVGVRGRPHVLGNVAPMLGKNSGFEDFLAWMGRNFDPQATWRDLEFIRQHWPGPIILKGILDRDDAIKAADSGVDAIIVSNHGGRQLDGVPSTAVALPDIASAVGDRLIVMADGGVRSGLDVLRMLALGAKFVLLGRAWAYGLAGAGRDGVAHVIQLIEAELRIAMALTGRTALAQIDRTTLAIRD